MLNKTQSAKVENAKASVKEIAALAYCEKLIDQKGEEVSDATAISAIIGDLEKNGYEVITVANSDSIYDSIEILEMIGATGNSVTSVTLQQTDSTILKINLKMTEGISRVYVNILGKYYELTVNDSVISLSEDGQTDITGEEYTIKLIPTTEKATMKLGGTEITGEQTIVSGTELTVIASETIGDEDFTIKVESSNGYLKDTVNGRVTVVQKPIHATALEIVADSNEVTVGDTLQLSVNTTPEVITDTIEWKSSDEDIATVSNTGLVEGKEVGEVTITVNSRDSDGNITQSATYIVEVKQLVQPEVGDFVNYAAGDWTSDDIDKITASGAKIEPNKSTDLPSANYQFGGFVVGGSRNENATPYYSSYVEDKDDGSAVAGWRIFDISDTGEITLISAGCPEDYYHPRNTNTAYISEYILTGNVNDDADATSLGLGTTYVPRDWSMYKNETQGATNACVLTKEKLDEWSSKYVRDGIDSYIDGDEFRNIYGSYPNCVNNGRYESLIDNGLYYLLASTYMYDGSRCSLFSFCTWPAYDVSYYYDVAFGVRVLITLSSKVLLSADEKDTKTIIYPKVSTNAYEYNVWDIVTK